MPQPVPLVTAAEISRIAGVTRATVSNWRRRHEDFPAPAGGTESSPLYDLGAVRAWLTGRGHTVAANPAEELRTMLRLRAASGSGSADLLVLVLSAARSTPADLKDLALLPDAELATRTIALEAAHADRLPEGRPAGYAASDAPAIRALLECVREEGPQAALAVLAERELEESAASGTYVTPEPLAELAARLLPGSALSSVLDPACGSGSLLGAAAARGARVLYGQDTHEVQAVRGAVRLELAAPGAEITVRHGDSLRSDAFPDLAVDAVLCNPPYGDRDWGHDELAYDARWAFGVPSRTDSELAWVQHALAHLGPGGHAVLVMPPATAARPSGRRVRRELVRQGALRAVVALPAGAAQPFHVGLHLWVLAAPDPSAPVPGSVLFVDTAAPDGEAGDAGERAGAARARNPLRAASVDWARVAADAVTAWEAFRADPAGLAAQPNRVRAVETVDLLDDQCDLTPARLVRVSPAEVDPAELATRAAATVRQLDGVVDELGSVADLAVGRVSAAAGGPREWRTATASDLARGGALAALRLTTESRGAETEPAPGGGGRVLTARHIAAGAPADASEPVAAGSPPVIEVGDVLVRGITSGGGPVVRVATKEDAGAVIGLHVHLLRPDPARLDSWFLAGFVAAPYNIAGASTGTSAVHLSPGRLRIPLMPLEEQRRYGEAFRRAQALRDGAVRAARLAEDAAELLLSGLTGGQLIPQAEPEGDEA